jgi:hypothetical protein
MMMRGSVDGPYAEGVNYQQRTFPPKVAIMIAIGHTSIMILLAVVALAAIGVAFTTFTRNPRN